MGRRNTWTKILVRKKKKKKKKKKKTKMKTKLKEKNYSNDDKKRLGFDAMCGLPKSSHLFQLLNDEDFQPYLEVRKAGDSDKTMFQVVFFVCIMK